MTDKNEEIVRKRQAKIQLELEKQKECQLRALRIVESMLEGPVKEEELLKQSQYLDPGFYQDIVTERAIVRLCGYPLCGEKLRNVPKQKYHISTHQNKVYDITDRKNFCSNFCYKASRCFESQLSSSPVWLRDEEEPEQIVLLENGEEQKRSGMGAEVIMKNQEAIEAGMRELQIGKAKSRAGDTSPRSDSLPQADSKAKTDDVRASSKIRNDCFGGMQDCKTPSDSSVIKEKEKLISGKSGSNQNQSDRVKDEDMTNIDSTPEKIIPIAKDPVVQAKLQRLMDLIDKREHLLSKQRHFEQNKSGIKDTKTSQMAKTRHVEESTESHGLQARDEIVETSDAGATASVSDVGSACKEKAQVENKEQVFQNKTCIRHDSAVTEMSSAHQEQKLPVASRQKLPVTEPQKMPGISPLEMIYQKLFNWTTVNTCRFLIGNKEDQRRVVASQEFDKKYSELSVKVDMNQLDLDPDSKVKVESDSMSKMPDMKRLQNDVDSKLFSLKVKEYFKGRTTVTMPVEEEDEVEQDAEKSDDPVLPLVDSHSQMAIRRKIVLERLGKVFPDLLQILKLTLKDISSDIRYLVGTFNLSSQNVMLKPAEWTVMAILLLKLLSFKNQILHEHMESASVKRYMDTVLKAIGGNYEKLDTMMKELLKQKCE